MATTTHSTTSPDRIVYDPETKDYALILNGVCVGYATTEDAGWRRLLELKGDITVAVYPVPLDCADLAATFRTDKVAAARQVATLTPDQQYRQAVAYASFLNELHGLELTAREVLANFERGIARFLGAERRAA